MNLKTKAAKFQRIRSALEGLREVADGRVTAAVIVRFGRYIRGRITGELDRHIKTWLARNSAVVVPQAKSLGITLQRYYRYIPWSWKKGIPVSVLNRGRKIVVEEIERATGGRS